MDERNAATRLYFLNMILLALLGATLCISLAVSSFSVRLDGLTAGAVLTGPALTGGGLWLLGREWRWAPKVAFASLAVAQIGFIGLVCGPFSYLLASADFSLQDANFVYFDRLLGFDWPGYFALATSHPQLCGCAILFYTALMVPPMGVPLSLALFGHYIRLQQFVMATILTLLVVLAVSSVLPAYGAYYGFGLPADTELFRASGYLTQMHDLPSVRDGTFRVLDLTHLAGIVTFPSFHAAAGILAIWGFWAIWWMRPMALIVFGGMLLATPLVGGHYFVDVLSGVVVAALAIGAAKTFRGTEESRGARLFDFGAAQFGHSTIVTGR